MTDFANDLQTIRDVFAVLANHAELPEITADIAGHLTPELIGQLIMECLDPDLFASNNKRFWFDVSEHMGPDYLDSLSKAVAFMRRVQNFG